MSGARPPAAGAAGARWSVPVVAAAAILAFATALHGSFVNWDDEWLIVDNPHLRGFHHVKAVFDPFGERALLGAEYLPLRDLSNMVDFAIFGLDPAGYRLGNLLLHALAAAAAYVVLREALGRPRAALAGALLFAVHPLHAEAVAWASARKDALNAALALTGAALHLRSARTGSRVALAGGVALFTFATLAKTAAAALPLALVVIEVVRAGPAAPLAARARRALLRAAPLLAVAAAGAALNAHHQAEGAVRAEWRGGGYLENLFIVGGVQARYLRQALLPFGLSPDYAAYEDAPLRAAHVAGVVVAAAALVATAMLLRRRPVVGAWAAWWWILLAPVSNLVVPITNLSADRYLLLPSLGVAALAGVAFDGAMARGGAAARFARSAFPLALALLGVMSLRQARFWRDGLSLWSRAVEVSPDSGRAWQNLGEALAAAGRREEALAAYRRMVEAEPSSTAYRIHAGNRLWALAGPGAGDDAEAILREAIRRARPGDGSPHVALAWLVNQRGRVEESAALLEEAVRRQPRLAEANLNLGLYRAATGDPRAAVRLLETALDSGLGLHDAIRAHDAAQSAWRALGDEERSRRHRQERDRKRALTRGW